MQVDMLSSIQFLIVINPVSATSNSCHRLINSFVMKPAEVTDIKFYINNVKNTLSTGIEIKMKKN